MTALLEPQELTTPTEEERRQALEASRFLASPLRDTHSFQIVAGDGHSFPLSLPAPALRLLYEILREMAAGNAVTVLPVQTELTTQQAADYLNVSRPYLVKMLDEGQLPSHKIGTHRRVRLEDIVAYKRADDARSLAILQELTAEAQEMGFY